MSEVIEQPTSTELDAAIKEANLSEKMGAELLEIFQPYFNEARPLVEEAMKITVTSADQLTEMSRARELRLKLVKIRNAAEKARKETKDEALNQCRAIDNVGRVVKDMMQTAEAILKEHETFAERAEAERKEKLKSERARKLEGLCENPAVFDLANMSDGDFENLLAGQKAAKREKEEAERRAREEAEAAEKQRQAEAEKARAQADADRKARAEAEATAKAEREAREKAERELQSKKDAEAKAERDRQEAARKAAAAPDAEKLRAFADRVDALAREMPDVADEAMKKIANGARATLYRVASAILDELD